MLITGFIKYLTIIAVACFLTMPAFGHHSDAALDLNSIVRVEGIVTEYSLRNPHAYFTVKAKDSRGVETDWSVQMASSITMARLGWDAETLRIGERVTVRLHPARDGRQYGLVESVEKANGVALVSSPSKARRPVYDATATSIFGKWIVDRARLPQDYPGGLDQLMIRELKLTQRGSIAEAAYSQNSDDNPELSCVSKPTPSLIIYTDLYPMEFVANDDRETITIRSQYFDTMRTIYMDGREHPDSSEQFHEGHSIGWWENDTLVIDTKNFAYHRSPYQNGIPSSTQKHVVERYQLIDNGARMEVEFVLEDPEYLVGSMKYSRQLLFAPNRDMSPFNCDLESTRRFLPKQ
jgi:hypothetical protein